MKKSIQRVLHTHRRILSILLIELVATAVLLFIHTFIGQTTATALLNVSKTAFSYDNSVGLLQVLFALLASVKIEVLIVFLVLSLRTVLVLLIEKNAVPLRSIWRLISPRFLLTFFVSGLCALFLVTIGFIAFLLPGFIMLFLLHSWLIELVSFSQSGLRPATSSFVIASRCWRSLIKPFLLMTALSIALTIFISYLYINYSGGGVVITLLMLSALLFFQDLLYLHWQKIYLSKRQPIGIFHWPVWLTVVLIMGLSVTALVSFVIIRAVMGISNNVSVRQQLLYDVLPPAETQTLLDWQQQLELQSKRSLTPEEQNNLDTLINQMSQELSQKATESASPAAIPN